MPNSPNPVSRPETVFDHPLLRVEDLKAYFFMDEGTVRAVDGVSFDVQPGKVVGIVGESGCGKSVTMKAILQILEPSARIVSGKATSTLRVIGRELKSIAQEPPAAATGTSTTASNACF